MEFISGINVNLLDRLATYASKEVSQAWGARDELKKLSDTWVNIRGVLRVAEKKQMENSSMARWIVNLKDVCSDIENLLDGFDYREQFVDQQSFKEKVHKYFDFNLGRRIKKIRHRLDQIGDEKNKYFLSQDAEAAEGVYHYKRETDSVLLKGYVVAREKDKKQIITHLLNDNNSSNKENVSVISIYGLGGLGKTTLAQMVYNDGVVEENFELRIWMSLSGKFDIHTLVSGIIAETKQKCNCESLNLMKEGLQAILRSRKFLLVLDDVCDTEVTGVTLRKWLELKTLLDVGAKGSRIIVTTRGDSVASLVSSTYMHPLDGLSFEDSIILFKMYAFGEGEEQRSERMMEIGKVIVKKCRGNALALTTLGSMLRLKKERLEWIKARDDEIWKEKGSNGIMAALKLSYDALPCILKPCFVFCSLYPKGYLFSSEEMVSLWRAENFLTSSRENEDFEEVGLDYIRQFCSRSLFQVHTDWKTGVIFKIHDLVHDLAIKEAGGEYSTVNRRPSAGDEASRRSSTEFERVQHVSLSAKDLCKEAVPENILQSKKLRTMLNVDSDAGIFNQNSIETCMSFKYMRVLDATCSTFEELPSSIGDLIHLRYLKLDFNDKMKKLPCSIWKLMFLQFLSLEGCSALKEVPEGIGNLTNLRYLNITTQQGSFPEGVFRRLTNLQHLVIVSCVNLTSLGTEIGCLTDLRQLFIHSCGNLEFLPPDMGNTKLHTLMIEGKKLDLMRNGQSIRTLRSVTIQGISDLKALPDWLEKSAGNLQCMVIDNCAKLTALPEWLQQLTSLERLFVVECPKLSALPQGMHRLTALRELGIVGCAGLSERCKRGTGEDWSKIEHVPKTMLDEDLGGLDLETAWRSLF